MLGVWTANAFYWIWNPAILELALRLEGLVQEGFVQEGFAYLPARNYNQSAYKVRTSQCIWQALQWESQHDQEEVFP